MSLCQGQLYHPLPGNAGAGGSRKSEGRLEMSRGLEYVVEDATKKVLDEQLRKARILRQKQVRQQANQWSETQRKKFDVEKQRQKMLLAQQVTEQVEQLAKDRIEYLLAAHDMAVAEVGSAHRNAAKIREAEEEKLQKVEEMKVAAAKRGQSALKNQHAQMRQKDDKRKEFIERKQQIRKAEDRKSQELIRTKSGSAVSVDSGNGIETTEAASRPEDYHGLRTSQPSASPGTVGGTGTSGRDVSAQNRRKSSGMSENPELSEKQTGRGSTTKPPFIRTGPGPLRPLNTTRSSSGAQSLPRKQSGTPTKRKPSFPAGHRKASKPNGFASQTPSKLGSTSSDRPHKFKDVVNEVIQRRKDGTYGASAEIGKNNVRYFDSAIPRPESTYRAPKGLAQREEDGSPDAWENAEKINKMTLEEVKEKARKQEEMLRRAKDRGDKALKKAKLERRSTQLISEFMSELDSDASPLGTGNQDALLGLEDEDVSDRKSSRPSYERSFSAMSASEIESDDETPSKTTDNETPSKTTKPTKPCKSSEKSGTASKPICKPKSHRSIATDVDPKGLIQHLTGTDGGTGTSGRDLASQNRRKSSGMSENPQLSGKQTGRGSTTKPPFIRTGPGPLKPLNTSRPSHVTQSLSKKQSEAPNKRKPSFPAGQRKASKPNGFAAQTPSKLGSKSSDRPPKFKDVANEVIRVRKAGNRGASENVEKAHNRTLEEVAEEERNKKGLKRGKDRAGGSHKFKDAANEVIQRNKSGTRGASENIGKANKMTLEEVAEQDRNKKELKRGKDRAGGSHKFADVATEVMQRKKAGTRGTSENMEKANRLTLEEVEEKDRNEKKMLKRGKDRPGGSHKFKDAANELIQQRKEGTHGASENMGKANKMTLGEGTEKDRNEKEMLKRAKDREDKALKKAKLGHLNSKDQRKSLDDSSFSPMSASGIDSDDETPSKTDNLNDKPRGKKPHKKVESEGPGPYTSTPVGPLKPTSSRSIGTGVDPKDLILHQVVSEFLTRRVESIELLPVSSSSSSGLKVDSTLIQETLSTTGTKSYIFTPSRREIKDHTSTTSSTSTIAKSSTFQDLMSVRSLNITASSVQSDIVSHQILHHGQLWKYTSPATHTQSSGGESSGSNSTLARARVTVLDSSDAESSPSSNNGHGHHTQSSPVTPASSSKSSTVFNVNIRNHQNKIVQLQHEISELLLKTEYDVDEFEEEEYDEDASKDMDSLQEIIISASAKTTTPPSSAGSFGGGRNQTGSSSPSSNQVQNKEIKRLGGRQLVTGEMGDFQEFLSPVVHHPRHPGRPTDIVTSVFDQLKDDFNCLMSLEPPPWLP